MIVDDKIMELWLTSIYLHALNLQPITESKILPPNGLSKQSIEFCDDLYTHNYQIWHNIFGRTTDLTNSITNYKELPEYNIDTLDSVAVAMSGGKESILSYHIMKLLGCKVSGIFVDYVGRIKRREGQRLYNHLALSSSHNVSRIKSDLIDLLCLVPLEFGKHSMYLSPTICLILMQAYSERLSGLTVGNEYDNTCPTVQHNVPYFGDNYEQSTVFERKISQYLKDIGINIVVFSPVYNLSETCIQWLVSKTPYLKFQESCMSPVESDGQYISCGSCAKCKRIAVMKASVGIDNTFDPSIFQDDPNHIVNSQSGSDEIETILYLLYKRGYHINSKIQLKFHPEVFSYTIDELHPLISKNIQDIIVDAISSNQKV